MKSINNALLAYSAGKLVLAIGTIVVLFNAASGIVPHWPPVAQALLGFLITCILLPLLDGSWDYLEDVLRSMNGQSASMPKATRVLFFTLGGLGVAGSMFLSIIAAQMLSSAVVEDKSQAATEIETAKARGDANYLQLVQTAERNVKQAQQTVAQLQAAEAQAEKNAVASIGGDFAKQWNAGNAWVRSAPEVASQRRKISKAVQAAQAQTAKAQTTLAEAQAAYNDILTTGRAEASTATAAVVNAHTVVLNKWLSDLRNTTGFFIRIDIAAGVLCVLLLFMLFKAKAIPDDRTLMEVFTKAVRLAGDAVVYALGVSVDAAERGAKNVGFVAHPNIATFVAPSQQKAQQRKRNTGATSNPQYRSAMSAKRNALSAIRKAEQAFANGTIDADRLNAIIATKQAAISRNERKAAQLKNRKR